MTVLRPAAVVFDWDDTLIDNWGAIRNALNAAFVAMGHETWTLAETRARVRRSLRDTFPAMFGERWTEARDIFYATYRADHLETLTPLAGAAETLAYLAGEGIALAVVSNKTGVLLRRESEHLGWDSYFSALVGAGDAAADKPDPAPMTDALAPAGMAPSRDIWFVGDTWVDMACAKAAGCVPVLFGHRSPDAEEFADCRPEMVARDQESLAILVREAQKAHIVS